MRKTVLILGASGRFGRNAHNAFAEAGWQVRLFNRKTDDLWDAAWGADVIVNGWNPLYPDWATTIPGYTKQVIDVAEASGALVIVPGNVYVFGETAPSRFAAEVPHAATNPLGRIRAEMEAAYRNSKARVLILRAGDFLDTEASGNWFDKIMVAGLDKGRFVYPGPTDVPHAWAYLPDMARAAALLAERADELPRFTDLPFPGYTLTGQELHAQVNAAAPGTVKLRQMSWLPLRLAGLFWPMGRKLVEMSYLWSKPHHLDGAAFDRLLPEFRPTPLTGAIAASIEHKVHPDQPVRRRGHYIGKARIA